MGRRDPPHLAFYEKDCLDAALTSVADELKHVERRLRTRRQQVAAAAPREDRVAGLIVRSDGMRRAIDLARRVAQVDSTVLDHRRERHRQGARGAPDPRRSARAGGAVRGHQLRRGSRDAARERAVRPRARRLHRRATQDRPGLFEAADGGTLFLDEVGEMPPAMQAKLLRVLQEREVRRVGENRARKVDVRVIAATNRDLDAEVARPGGSGRTSTTACASSSRTSRRCASGRRTILPLLASSRCRGGARTKRKVLGFDPQRVNDLLARYGWPGNVRELENAMERAVALAQGDRIVPDDLPEEIRLAVPGGGAARAAGGAHARRRRARLRARGPGGARRKPDPHRRGTRDRNGDALPEIERVGGGSVGLSPLGSSRYVLLGNERAPPRHASTIRGDSDLDP